MPYRVLLSEIEALAVVELSGVVRWDDVAAALCALYGHPAWAPTFDALWDARAITTLDIPPTDLPAARALLAEMAATRSGGRSAVVVRDELDAALVMLFAHMAPPSRRIVEAFFRLEDALAFLGRPALPAGVEVASSDAAPL